MELKQTKKSYVIRRILNNSSIVVDGFLTERILVGKGIGFNRKVSDTLPIGTYYEKTYQLLDKASDFRRIINGYDELIVEMVMDTVHQIMKSNSGEFTMNDLVTIADHLAAMFVRVLNGEAILSFFSQETKTLYPDSFQKAEAIATIIQKDYQVQIPKAEIAYIALYIENLNGAKSKKEVEQLSAILMNINELFESESNFEIDKNSMVYSRFLIHIHLLVNSSGFRKTTLNPAINTAILTTYPQYKVLAEKIIIIIEDEIERTLSESELIYLIIHLVNLFETHNN